MSVGCTFNVYWKGFVACKVRKFHYMTVIYIELCPAAGTAVSIEEKKPGHLQS